MTQQIGNVDFVISNLSEIHDDSTVPRNVRSQVLGIINTLREDKELSMKVNKTLNDLDQIANDVNLQSYTRTQIWNVMSLLEKLQ